MSGPESSPRLSWHQRLIVALVILLLAVWVGFAGAERLSTRFDPQPARTVPPPTVETHAVVLETVAVERVYRGTVEAERRANISSRVAAQVLEIPHRAGAIVRRGDILARLDDEELRRETERLTAVGDRLAGELATARRERSRQEDLHQRSMTPERSLDDARQRVDTLEAQVRENAAALGGLRRRLSYAEERAPFEGVVQRVHAHEGEFVATGQSLIEMLAFDSLKAVVHVPQVDAPLIRPGLPARLEIPTLVQVWPAEVDRVHPALDAASRSATFAAFFPEGADGVRPGMAVLAHVELARLEQAVRLPAHAVHGHGADRWVFVLEEGLARYRPVQVRTARSGDYVITGGLAAGEHVIVTPNPRIGEGVPVRTSGERSP